MYRVFRTTRLYATREEVLETVSAWSAKNGHGWSMAVMGPFYAGASRETQPVPSHRLYPVREDGPSILRGWMTDEGGQRNFSEREFIVQLIRDDIGAEPRQDRRFPVDRAGYYGVPEFKFRAEPGSWSWSSVEISLAKWLDWDSHDHDPRWLVYLRAFCEIRALLRRRATLYSRRSGPMTVGVSTRNATPGFRDLVASRPGFGNLVIEQATLNPGLSLYDIEGILDPDDHPE